MDTRLSRLIGLCLERNIPFVIYRLPGKDGRVVVRIQQSGRMLFLENLVDITSRSGFVYAPFHRSTNMPVVLFEPELIVDGNALEEPLLQEIERIKPLYGAYDQDLPAETARADYDRQASDVLEAFGPDLLKVVLSRVKRVKKPVSFDHGKLFMNLASTYPDAFVHLIHIPGAGTWMGATPEVLFRSGSGKALTTALAGTRKRNDDLNAAWGDKELEEQRMVAVHIEDVLRKSGISKYTCQGPHTVAAGSVQHLSTRFTFTPDPTAFDVLAFLNLLHPTPAVSGLPVAPAVELIQAIEKHNREYYTGFCGMLDLDGSTDLFVNLRCMKVLPHHLAVYTGGGLTARSVIPDEWMETEWKAKTLLNLI